MTKARPLPAPPAALPPAAPRILRPRAAWQPEALLAHLAAGLPHFMLPRYLDRREALPRSNTNKVQKAVLRAEGIPPGLWDRHAEGVSVRDLYAKETTPC